MFRMSGVLAIPTTASPFPSVAATFAVPSGEPATVGELAKIAAVSNRLLAAVLAAIGGDAWWWLAATVCEVVWC